MITRRSVLSFLMVAPLIPAPKAVEMTRITDVEFLRPLEPDGKPSERTIGSSNTRKDVGDKFRLYIESWEKPRSVQEPEEIRRVRRMTARTDTGQNYRVTARFTGTLIEDCPISKRMLDSYSRRKDRRVFLDPSDWTYTLLTRDNMYT